MSIYKFAIYDSSNNIENVELIIKSMAMMKKWDHFSILKISNLNTSNIMPYVHDTNFFFISLKSDNALILAEKTAKRFPFCKIIFYDYEKNVDINSIVKSRPLACAESIRELESLAFKILDDSQFQNDVILFENKEKLCFFPIDKVVYFSSSDHYINVIYSDKRTADRFKNKLEKIQHCVSNSLFVRIHKSYLVSLLYVSHIDKKTHTLVMKNGDELPISDRYYKSTVDKIRQICSLKP